MSNNLYTCPHCHDLIIKSQGNETKIRSKVLIFRGDSCYVVCKGCDNEVLAPLSFDETIMKSISSKHPALYISKK